MIVVWSPVSWKWTGRGDRRGVLLFFGRVSDNTKTIWYFQMLLSIEKGRRTFQLCPVAMLNSVAHDFVTTMCDVLFSEYFTMSLIVTADLKHRRKPSQSFATRLYFTYPVGLGAKFTPKCIWGASDKGSVFRTCLVVVYISARLNRHKLLQSSIYKYFFIFIFNVFRYSSFWVS